MNKKCAGTTENILNTFKLYLSQKGRSASTIKTYISVMHLFSNWLEQHGKHLSELAQTDIQAYLNYLEQEKSTTTITKTFNAINTFTKVMNQHELMKGINRTPVEISKQIPEYLCDEQVDQLLTLVKNSENKRNKAIVYTLLYTGVRVSELCLLNKPDVKLNPNKKTGQVIVKNDSNERIIPLPKELITHLYEYLKERNDDNEALFISNYQKRMAPRTVQHMLKEQYKVYPHKLRHTFCFNLLRKGMDISIVAQLLGHSDLNITRQYYAMNERRTG